MAEKIICEKCKEFNHRSEFETMDAYVEHLKTSQHEISYNAFMSMNDPRW